MDELNSPDPPIPAPAETGFSDTENYAAAFSDNETAMAVESSAVTIRRVLSSYDIGNKIRQLRLRKKIALVDLGKHTGLSASMLSQLENGKLVPTLATLARVAMVFDVGLDYFFGDRTRKRTFLVVRGNERIQFPDRPGSARPDYVFECLAFSAQEKSMQAYLADFPPRGPEEVSEHFHEGAEFFHVIEGTIAIRYQGQEHVLEAGDSVYFDSSEPHAYRGASAQTGKAFVVTTPPRL